MSRPQAPLIVAIDGPSGVGKSTVARLVSDRLGLPYLETGAMYRAVGLKVLEQGVDPGNEQAVVDLAAGLDMDFEVLADGKTTIRLDGKLPGDRLRDEDVARVTSRVAAYPGVRRRLVELQRQFGYRLGGVVEGRDIGTKVFPDTPFKFFLDAPTAVRAHRRFGEHLDRGGAADDLTTLERELVERDRRDAQRLDSPLRRDASHLALDTTAMTAEQVAERMIEHIRQLSGSAE